MSPTTVSHALNGKGRLPEETRTRIRQIAQDLGYRPSATARNLQEGRTGLLGLAVPSASVVAFQTTDVDYFVQLTSSATRTAMDCGYALVVATAAADGTSPFERVQIDGAIVIDPVEDDDVVRELRGANTPVVTTGRVPGWEQGPWVDNDHRAEARLVLSHLRRQGASRPGLMITQPQTSFAHDVESSYERWCADHQLEPIIVRVRPDLSEDVAADAAKRLFDSYPDCDAVFATLDRLALATLREAQHRGLEVPNDFRIVGATDSEAARWALPSLTVLNLQPDMLGTTAAEMLVELVEGRALAEPHQIIPSKLIARASTRRDRQQDDGTPDAGPARRVR